MNAPKDSRVAYLACDYVHWGMHAILATPLVLGMAGASYSRPHLRFLAGMAAGVVLMMWVVILWAWLTRKCEVAKLSEDYRTDGADDNDQREGEL